MPSILALVSKAVFDRLGAHAPGDRLQVDRYVSASKALAPLDEGGALVLVTVRPEERLWLCAVLEEPRFEETMWRAAASDVPITDVTHLLPSIRLANGKGIQAAKGKLGMSLQTPRVLAEEDLALFRQALGAPTRARELAPARRAKAATARKPAPKPKPVPEPTPEPLAPPRPAAVAVGSDVDALFASIAADPDDIDARRVLADRMMEAGDPHGEYIRLACDAAALLSHDPRRAELEAQALRLRRVHSLSFSRRLRAVPYFNRTIEDGPWGSPFAWDRGFPEIARGDATTLVPAFLEAAKVSPVRGLCVTLEEDAGVAAMRALAGSPELGAVRSLELRCPYPSSPKLAAAITEVLASPHLRRLEHLRIDGHATAPMIDVLERSAALEGLRSLALVLPAASPPRVDALLRGRCAPTLRSLQLEGTAAVAVETIAALPALEDVSLSSASLGATGARLLAEKGPRGLRSLILQQCDVGGLAGLRALAAAPGLPELANLELVKMGSGKDLLGFLDAAALPALTRLVLADWPVRAEGAERLARAGAKWAGLRTLRLAGGKLGDDGARVLARLDLPSLHGLLLNGNGIGADGMGALAKGPVLANIRELDLRNNKCMNEGGQRLAEAKGLAGLRKLSLFYNWMGVGGVRALLAASPNLEEVSLGENNYGVEPMRFVASSTEMKRLRVANLRGDARAATVLALATSPAARSLEELTIESTTFDAEGARALAALPVLEQLHLSFTQPDEEARAILRARFGPNLTSYGGFHEWNALPGPA